MARHLKVLIIGAGTGGLCLAQGLKKDGIAANVFERDHTPTDRLQGYRLSLSATGNRALKACLPDTIFDSLVKCSAQPSQRVSFQDHRLNRLLAVDLPHNGQDPLETEHPVSRTALRRVLLEGLDDIVHFGKRFTGYDAVPAKCVTARFEDGSVAIGDILVGADGAGSQVRAELLPQAKRVQTGILAVSGKLGLSDRVRVMTPAPILRGPALFLGPRGCFMFCSAVQYAPGRPADPSSGDAEEYVMWGFSARLERFGFSAPPETSTAFELKARVLGLMEDWHPALRRLVQEADDASLTAFAVKTSVPISPWPTRNVTLLGDALHNMTPFRGIGANTALRDADALRRALVAVDRGDADLIEALAHYERDMTDYGFRAVRASLANMHRFHAESALTRGITKALFRVVDFVPPLKSAFLGRQ